MKRFKQVFSFCLVFALIVQISGYAFADSDSHTSTPVGFWQNAIHSLSSITDTFSGVFLVGPVVQQMYNEFGGIVSWKSYCSVTEDHLHRTTNVSNAKQGIDDDGNYYCILNCDFLMVMHN